MMEPDGLAVILRALVYVGAIGIAGGVLFSLSFPEAAGHVERLLRWQIMLGCGLLILAEPLRYVAFQLAAAEDNWTVAFSPGVRWMALQTAMGQAVAARLFAAILLLAFGRRWPGISLVSALVLITSFAMEGHTMSSGSRLLLAPLLLIHFAAICWWLGALYPLLDLTRQAPPKVVAATARDFGRRAAWIVGALLVGGLLLLIALSGVEVRSDSAYQRRFVIKLALVAALLSLATWNKLRLTPLLNENYALGAAKLRRSIRCEIALALMILAATAWIISTSPSD